MELAVYRQQAEQFIQSLELEWYRHFAGHKDTLEIEEIYNRHAALFTREAIDELKAHLAQVAPGSDEQRARRMLLDFAVEHYIGQLTKSDEEELAGLEAKLTIDFDGSDVPFRQASGQIAKEPDADRRAEISDKLAALTASELTPVARRINDARHQAARELGYESYAAMCTELKGYDLARTHAQTQAFVKATDELYPALIGEQLERVTGVKFEDMRKSDFPRFRRAPGLDHQFPAKPLLDTLYATAAGMGIDIRTQNNVTLDVEERANKSPRAFCSPVRSPDEVYLVISPTGGRDDYEALFHEAGHTEHFAHMDPNLPFEFRHLGDNAITESFAFLFEHLIENPRWLAKHLGATEPEALADYARASRVMFLRRYANKLAYELELHGADAPTDQVLAARYAELAAAAVGCTWGAESYLTDVDPGFYCMAYLRAWALEAHMRRLLIERFGEAWFEDPGAAELLREWWAEGQRLSAEEMLEELTGETLDFNVLLEDLSLV
jgi:oligoendopeptidase F